MPFFSVIIPLYNKERYIRRSLDSVLGQSFTDFEIVVVDDGSTDNSPDIVRAYKDPRIRVIQQPNAGVAAARNRGIAEAKAQWLAFLDADDEYLPEFLVAVRRVVEIHPQAGAVFCRSLFCKTSLRPHFPEIIDTRPQLLEDYFSFVHDSQKGGFEINSSCVAVRADVFKAAGTFPEGIKVGEDSDMWIRIALTTPIIFLPVPLAMYHIDAGDSNWHKRLDIPYWFHTFEKWRDNNRIPEHLRHASLRYYAIECLGRAILLARYGKREIAHTIIRKHASFKDAPIILTLRALFFVYACPLCFQEPLRRLLKSLKRFIPALV